jgi:hypothetical protein
VLFRSCHDPPVAHASDTAESEKARDLDATRHRRGSGLAPRIDSTILKATARARQWFDDLVSGRAASMVEIGCREGAGKRYVSRMIRLAFLAPAIVERIAEGRQPPELTAQFLSTGRGDLPLSWQAQEKLLGFAGPA